MIWELRGAWAEGETEGCTKDIDPLDGDLFKVKPVDLSIDIGGRAIDITTYWQCGRHLDPTYLPNRLKVTAVRPCRRDKPLLYEDYINWGGGQKQLVSAAFRDVVEAHDPGAHQFVPVQAETSKGEVISHDYFWFVPGNRVFALDPYKSTPPMKPYPVGPDFVNPHSDRPAFRWDQGARPVEDWAPVFHADKLGDRDLFCDGEFRRSIFISDRLKRAFEAADLVEIGARGPYRAE